MTRIGHRDNVANPTNSVDTKKEKIKVICGGLQANEPSTLIFISPFTGATQVTHIHHRTDATVSSEGLSKIKKRQSLTRTAMNKGFGDPKNSNHDKGRGKNQGK
ncbi:hypothetical protein NL676_008546 [Syzygium grande]|nr:hypothetical protein NL676_008546 [Syzygium grande]